MMLIALLAGAATAATADPGTPPGLTPPSWYKTPSSEQWVAAWPTKSGARMGGQANLDCRVSVHGVAEDCHVQSERPAGSGVGAAALRLIGDFRFKPATIAGNPVPFRIVIPIRLNQADGGAPIYEPPRLEFALISHPAWARAPTFADLALAYPSRGGGKPGYDAFRCEVAKTGLLKYCALVREEPPGLGFGSAGRALIQKFQVEVTPTELAVHRTLAVNLPIRLIDPTSTDFIERHIGKPMWDRGVDPATKRALFPPEAAKKGLMTGVGAVACDVAVDGRLTDCVAEPGQPDGLGFSPMAVRVAGMMVMSRWTLDGGPVDGARVSLPIRFSLAPIPGAAGETPPR
jgi:hypothetical protein